MIENCERILTFSRTILEHGVGYNENYFYINSSSLSFQNSHYFCLPISFYLSEGSVCVTTQARMLRWPFHLFFYFKRRGSNKQFLEIFGAIKWVSKTLFC